MTMIAIGWIGLGLGLAMGFTLGRWTSEMDDRPQPSPQAVN
ncbi:hypothetical protein [Hyphomicrobium zavarzinii]|nr:hypothetical protein [Hyphomicrobium zavarzinii]